MIKENQATEFIWIKKQYLTPTMSRNSSSMLRSI